MRRFVLRATLLIIFGTWPILASGPTPTDAWTFGFVGPIRSVSATELKENLDWPVPNGPISAPSVGCWECEFDRDGNIVKFGQTLDGEFRGELTRLQRDADGHVTGKVFENAQGEMQHREVYGPYGITEQEGYENGKPVSRSFWFYDANGHLSGFSGYNRDESLASSSSSLSSADGNYKEEWGYGPNKSFSGHYVQTKDPKTHTWTFTSFNEDGTLKVTFTTVGTKVISYWQVPSDQTVYGSSFFMDRAGKTQESYSCHADGACDHLISYFPDESSRQVSRLEWHDGEGALKVAVDFEYALDTAGNWTKRTVWVWSSELGERKLHATHSSDPALLVSSLRAPGVASTPGSLDSFCI
jgi:hypothetical protein